MLRSSDPDVGKRDGERWFCFGVRCFRFRFGGRHACRGIEWHIARNGRGFVVDNVLLEIAPSKFDLTIRRRMGTTPNAKSDGSISPNETFAALGG